MAQYKREAPPHPPERGEGGAPAYVCTRLVRASGQDEMLGAARLVGVAGHFDGAVIESGFAFDQPLRVKGTAAAGTVGDAFGNVAAVGVHIPRQVEHLSKGKGAKVQVKTGDQNVVARVKKVARESEEIGDELPFVYADALHPLADTFFRGGDYFKNFPWVGGVEFHGSHLAMAKGIAALHHAWAALGVIAGLEHYDILAGVLAAHFGAPQEFRGFVASHRPHHQFQSSLHVTPSKRS